MERSSHVLALTYSASISDQEPAYEKYGKGVSTSIETFKDGNGTFDVPLYHIPDIGQLKKIT